MNRFRSLDIYRGIAALFVFFYHIRYQINLVSFFDNFWIFTDFFFVLSGFIISYNYKSIININDIIFFLKKRIIRIYPLHFIVTFIFLIKYILINHDFEFLSLFNNIFLLNSIFYNFKNLYNQPSWSISAEFINYILFVFYLLISSKIKLKPIYFVLILISINYLFILKLNLPVSNTNNLAFLRCGFSFFYGVLIELFFRKKKNIFQIINFFLFIFLIGLIFKLSIYYFIIFSFGLSIALTRNIEVKNNIFTRFFLFLGLISYSIYMLQSFVIYLFVLFFGSNWNFFNFIEITFLLIVISWFSYKYVELYISKKLNFFFNPFNINF